MNRRRFQSGAVLAGLGARSVFAQAAKQGGWSFVRHEERYEFLHDGRPIATYVSKHPRIRRPFFQDIFTPAGIRITRPNPPDPAIDDADHDTMHPGLWLAFGSLNGLDYWRNKAEIRHVRYMESPVIENDVLYFETENRYIDMAGENPVCRETTRFEFRKIGSDLVLDWVSKFTSVRNEIRFGHQEEMGLGVRLARPMTVKKGSGRIDSSFGGVDEKGTWGKTASWWAASIPVPAKGSKFRSGIQILPKFDPGDRPFWGHTRDYGLIVANPSPLPGSNLDSIAVSTANPVELHFRIRLFDSESPDLASWASKHGFVRSKKQ